MRMACNFRVWHFSQRITCVSVSLASLECIVKWGWWMSVHWRTALIVSMELVSVLLVSVMRCIDMIALTDNS